MGNCGRCGSSQESNSQSKPIEIRSLRSEADNLMKDQQYNEALTIYQQISTTMPDNEEIFQLIKECKECLNQIKASQYYEEGMELIKKGENYEALKRLIYIESYLCENYKDCKKKIIECEEDELNKQLVANQVEQKKKQHQNQTLNFKDVPLKYQPKKEEGQNHEAIQSFCTKAETKTPKLKFPYQIIYLSDELDEPNFSDKIEKIKIYYECQQKQQCKSAFHIPFRHDCGTQAFLSPDGLVSCEKDCETFFINDAVLHCESHEIFKGSVKYILAERFEAVRELDQIAILVEDCLKYDESSILAKKDFIRKMAVTMISFLKIA